MSKNKSRVVLTKAQKIMIAAVTVLLVLIIALAVLLVLEANGFFYKSDLENKDQIVPPKIVGEEYMEDDNGYCFKLLDDGTVILVGFLGTEQEIMRIPSSCKEYSVSAVGELAFALSSGVIKEIHVPEGVTYIGSCAFLEITGANVYLPSTLEQIDYQAFYGLRNPLGIYYNGSESDWQNIRIGSENNVLANVMFQK